MINFRKFVRKLRLFLTSYKGKISSSIYRQVYLKIKAGYVSTKKKTINLIEKLKLRNEASLS